MAYGDNFRSLAVKQIAAKGKAVRIVIVTSAYDDNLLTNVQTEVATDTKAIIRPGRALVPGSLVDRVDVSALVAALTLAGEPVTGDFIEFDGRRLRVVNVKPTYAGERPVVFDLEAVAQ